LTSAYSSNSSHVLSAIGLGYIDYKIGLDKFITGYFKFFINGLSRSYLIVGLFKLSAFIH